MPDTSYLSAIAQMDPRIRAAGRLHTSLVYVSLVTTNNTVLLTAPDGTTLFLWALEVYNRNATQAVLSIGTGAALVQVIPRQGPFLTDFSETVYFPLVEFESTIYVTSTVGAADPNDVQVKAYALAMG